MKNQAKKLGVAGMSLALSLFIPLYSRAQSPGMKETPFGGPETMFVDNDVCNCPGTGTDGTGTNVHFIMDYATHREIKLYKSEESKIYDKDNLDEIGKYQLGTYKKSIGGQDDCYQNTGNSCTLRFHVDGVYGNQPGTGTS
jgi:hypothetical protein